MEEDSRKRIHISANLKRQLVETAREFRKSPTRSEEILWQALRGRQLEGVKFRRQQPVGPFVVDFYAAAVRLVIEVDGEIHQSRHEQDLARQQILEELGLTILRFSAEQVDRILLRFCQKSSTQ